MTNDHFHDSNVNHYEGNGWSKYQIMVLQQLEDHNKVLQNLNKEIVDIKQTMAVTTAEAKLWRVSTVTTLENLEKKMSHVLYDETGVNQKVIQIQRELDVEEESSTKVKAIWAVYGAIVVFVINVGLQLAAFFFKK